VRQAITPALSFPSFPNSLFDFRIKKDYCLDSLTFHPEVQPMGNVWQLQEAKNKFSRLVEKARSDGPQIVTRHGKESVVILAVEEYKNLRKTKSDLVTFLRSSPLSEAPLDLSRDKNSSREVDVL